jgi:hypothetical protein
MKFCSKNNLCPMRERPDRVRDPCLGPVEQGAQLAFVILMVLAGMVRVPNYQLTTGLQHSEDLVQSLLPLKICRGIVSAGCMMGDQNDHCISVEGVENEHLGSSLKATIFHKASWPLQVSGPESLVPANPLVKSCALFLHDTSLLLKRTAGARSKHLKDTSRTRIRPPVQSCQGTVTIDSSAQDVLQCLELDQLHLTFMHCKSSRDQGNPGEEASRRVPDSRRYFQKCKRLHRQCRSRLSPS